MEKKIGKLFPIGSVVKVKEASKKMMIVGILQVSEKKEYDYMAVLYPEGYMTEKHLYLFNHEDIEEVCFLGYMNAEYQIFKSSLVEVIKGN